LTGLFFAPGWQNSRGSKDDSSHQVEESMSELAEIIRGVKPEATTEQCNAVADRFRSAADAALALMWRPRGELVVKPQTWFSLREELAATLGASGLAEAAALLEKLGVHDLR